MVGLIYIYDLPDRKCKLIVIKMLSKVRKATDEQCENIKKKKIFFKYRTGNMKVKNTLP